MFTAYYWKCLHYGAIHRVFILNFVRGVKNFDTHVCKKEINIWERYILIACDIELFLISIFLSTACLSDEQLQLIIDEMAGEHDESWCKQKISFEVVLRWSASAASRVTYARACHPATRRHASLAGSCPRPSRRRSLINNIFRKKNVALVSNTTSASRTSDWNPLGFRF